MKRKIIVGVTASIAVYKTCDVIRELARRDIDCDVVMTPDATEFVRPLMFSALIGKEVWVDPFSEKMPHIHLSRDKDLIVVCPATMDFINKFAAGICDSLLLSLCLASKAPIVIAPAMNPEMYAHSTTQNSLKLLKARGVQIIPPEDGTTVCGEAGPGRLASLDTLITRITTALKLSTDSRWKDVPVLITAGPTRNPIDPVRFITNASSGKMGVVLARCLADRGAQVILGLSEFATADASDFQGTLKRFNTHSSLEQLYVDFFGQHPTGVIVASAAPSDYEVVNASAEKRAKSDILELSLKPLPDLLARIAADRHPESTVVGFCVESQDLEPRARQKLRDKHCDYMIANGVQTVGNSHSSCLVLSARSEEISCLSFSHKQEVAAMLCDLITPLSSLKKGGRTASPPVIPAPASARAGSGGIQRESAIRVDPRLRGDDNGGTGDDNNLFKRQGTKKV